MLSPTFTKEESQALRNWTYDGSDSSYMAQVMKPFWIYLVRQFVPPGISPNIISLVGVSSIVFICCYVWTWFPTLSETAVMPFTLYFLCALGLFIFQTADAMDGQQGRRVQMYTHPSTELVDHGCDSVTTSMVAITTALTFRLGLSWRTALFMSTVWSIFWLSTWEHIHVGVMRFPSGLSNPTEAQFCTMSSFILFGLLQTYFLGLSINVTADIIVPFSTLLVIIFTIQSLSVTFATIRSISNSKKGFTTQTYLELFPKISILVCLWAFCLYPTPSIVQNQKMMLLFTASQWNLLILRMILAEMTKSQINVKHALVAQIPMVALACGCVFEIDALSYDGSLLALFIVSVFQYIHYLYSTRRLFEKVLGMENLWTSVQPWPPANSPAKVDAHE